MVHILRISAYQISLRYNQLRVRKASVHIRRMTTKRTTSAPLQLQLEKWVELVDTAIACTNPSVERSDAILNFCKVFVPGDVSEDDIDHFSGMLTTDEVNDSSKLHSLQIVDYQRLLAFFGD